MTQEGYQKVKQEFDELTLKRRGLVDKVKTAREMGDLSENAAYHEARRNLFDADKRLRFLKMQLVYGKVDENANGETAGLDSTVVVKTGSIEQTFRLVGQYEADPSVGKISIYSPIGKALLGKSIGEKVIVETPAKQLTFVIKSVTR